MDGIKIRAKERELPAKFPTKGKVKNTTREIAYIAVFIVLIIVGTFTKIPIPPVPFTLQFTFTNLAGILLGKKDGAIAVGIYIFMGLLGLPIFTGGGGIAYVLNPTFGYIIGFLFGAFFAGLITEKTNGSFRGVLVASLVNMAIVYIFGMIYFYLIANYYVGGNGITVGALIISCCLVTIASDIASCILSAFLYKRLKKAIVLYR